MKRPEIPNGSPKLPDLNGANLPVHLPKSPLLPQAPMLPVAPIEINEALDRIEAIGRGRAMDFKLMIMTPDGAQFYLEGSTDK